MACLINRSAAASTFSKMSMCLLFPQLQTLVDTCLLFFSQPYVCLMSNSAFSTASLNAGLPSGSANNSNADELGSHFKGKKILKFSQLP